MVEGAGARRSVRSAARAESEIYEIIAAALDRAAVAGDGRRDWAT